MKFQIFRSAQKPFLIKTAGGAASQLLGLMNAIYISKRIGRPFIVRHFPYSTGSYYPVAINFLLAKDEILHLQGKTKGLRNYENIEIGKVIKDHPLLSRHFTYEKLLNLIRKVKLEKILLRLRNEWSVQATKKRLDRTPKRISTVSGGYYPIVDLPVHEEMNIRFKRANAQSPFMNRVPGDISPEVVIHYRIGGKRGSFAFPELGIDGILDPESFKEILEFENKKDSTIYVVSDEPKVAIRLLENAGIHAKMNPIGNDLWSDLYLMTRAELLICPWSMVSQVAATVVVSYGRTAYYPTVTSTGNFLTGGIQGVKSYIPKFLSQEHAIYSSEFDLEEGSHSIYER